MMQAPSNPLSADEWYTLAHSSYVCGLLSKAQNECRAALKIDSNHAPAAYLLGQICESYGDVKKAERFFRVVIRNDPDNFDAYIRRAHCFERLGIFTSAVRMYKKAHQIRPLQLATLQNLTTLSAQLGRHSDAIKYARESLHRAPSNPHLYGNLALIYIKTQKYKLAEKTLHEGIVIDKSIANLHFLLARLYEREKQLKKADHSYSKAYMLDPSLSESEQ